MAKKRDQHWNAERFRKRQEKRVAMPKNSVWEYAAEMVMTMDGQRFPMSGAIMYPSNPYQFETAAEAEDIIRRLARQLEESGNAKARLDSLQTELKQRDEFIQQLAESAFILGCVGEVSEKRVTVRVGSAVFDAAMPKDGCKVGDFVKVAQPSNQILGVAPDAPRVGAIGSVQTVISPTRCEVSINGQSRQLVVAAHVGALEVGDQVVVDDSGYFVLAKAVGSAASLVYEDETGVTWGDIGGLDDAKEAIREAIEYPVQFADLYRAYGKSPSKGVLLYGPPGGGKTMLGKATATALRGHSAGIPGGFLYVKGPELLNRYVGATEESIRALFDKARQYKAKTGHAAVLFIDEADAILGRRGGRGFGLESTTVPAFLAEMDGLDDAGAFVMLATNRPDTLDAAVTRDGRIDRKILVGRPTKATAAEILKLHLRRRPLALDEDPDALVHGVVETMFDDAVLVLDAGTFEDKPVRLLFRDVISGAAIAGVVNRATDRALARDRESGAEPTGITASDVRASVFSAAREMAHTDLRAEIMDAIAMQVSTVAAKEFGKDAN